MTKIITSIAEKLLKPHRSKAELFKNENISEYTNYLPLIKKVYSEAYYWHGTGRYHYFHGPDSRYEGKNQNNNLDIFQSILENGGLTPHFDPWIDVEGDFIKTISLTRFRMHARLYSDAHRYENDFILYELGSTRYWLFLFMISVCMTIIRHPTKSAKKFIKRLLHKSSLKKLQIWAEATRKKSVARRLRFWKTLEAKSDITINYPILVGIKNKIQTLSISPFMDKYEHRTDQIIKFEDFSHFEVPLNKIAGFKDILLKNNITATVIPIEFGEIYCSQFPTEKLIYNTTLSNNTVHLAQ